MERIICLAAGYVFGLIQTGYLYGRINRIDIRNYGSGNSGTTNALRVLGKKAGVIVFFGDFLKAFLPCLAVRLLFRDRPEIDYLLILYTGLGVILGHNYPFYLNFKGGKGIAATAGLLVSLDFGLTLAALVVFILLVALTRFVSLGSLAVATLFFIWLAVVGSQGGYGLAGQRLPEFYIIAAIICLQAFWRHRANIIRLIKGKENKISFSKNKDEVKEHG